MRPLTILLIEDSDTDAEIVLLALDQSPIKTCLVIKKDGESAISYLKEQTILPDLVLLDWNLPKISGPEVLKFLKNGKLRTIPVVVFTTSKRAEDIEIAYDNHCNAFSVKPLEMEDTISRLKEIICFFGKTTELIKRR